MSLTPVDIRNKEFKKAMFGGYDKNDVDDFLDLVMQEMERLIREAARAQEAAAHLEQKLQEYRNLEETLNRTLIAAQETADGIKANARREAELIIQEARLQAERLVEAGQVKARRILQENAELQKQTEMLRINLQQLLHAQLELLERYTAAPTGDQVAAARGEGGGHGSA